MTPRKPELSGCDEVLADLRAELDLVPSPSFIARVRHQVERLETQSRTPRLWAWAVGAAAAAALGVAVVSNWGDPEEQPVPTRQTEVADSRPVPAATVPRSAAPMAATLDGPSPSSPAAHAVGPTADRRAPDFDPFTDVVVSAEERRGLQLLVARLEQASELEDERMARAMARAFARGHGDVRVMALNEPAPIDVAPIRVAPIDDGPAGMPR